MGGLFCLMAATPVLTACSDDEDSPKPEVKPAAQYGTYSGDFSAYLADGTLSKEGSGQPMRLLRGTAGDTLYMDKVRFSDKMPVVLDIRFDGIVRSADGRSLSLEGGARDPEMYWKGAWTANGDYRISAFSGRFSADSLYLDFKCGPHRLEYAGKFVGER